MKKFVFPAVIIAILFAIPVLNGKGPILGERKQVIGFRIGSLEIRAGYIK